METSRKQQKSDSGAVIAECVQAKSTTLVSTEIRQKVVDEDSSVLSGVGKD